MPVKDLDLGYNLVTTHDYRAAFVIVDHDELDPTKGQAPMSFVYSPGTPHQSPLLLLLLGLAHLSVLLLAPVPCLN